MNCISIRIVFADPRKIGLSLNRICNVFRDFQTELLRFQVLLGAFQDDGILGSGEHLLQGGGELLPVPYVYLLRCRDDSLYCGWTTDVKRRLAAHRSGTASRYTASRLPVELAMAISVADRRAALREEARIKRLDRAAKLQLIATASQEAARTADALRRT